MSENGNFRRAGGTGGVTAQIREHLEDKSEAEISEIMWDIFEESEDGAEIDPAVIDAILDILNERDPLPALDVESSLLEFKTRHSELLAGLDSAEQQSSASVLNPKKSRRVKPVQIFLAVVALAAMFAIASSCGVIEYIINAFARWTDETFHYQVTEEIGENEITQEDAEEKVYASLEEALDATGVDGRSIPKRFPEGFQFIEARVVNMSDAIKLKADYCRGSEYIGLSIWKYRDANALKATAAEKKLSNVQVYVRNGSEYYIIQNNTSAKATWIVGTEKYVISGNISVEELKMMIDSFVKDED